MGVILLSAVFTFCALCSLLADAATAQTVRGGIDRPYGGSVLALAKLGDTLYVGGEFDHVGPLTGNAVSLSPTTALLVDDLDLHGYTFASIPDGAGGWFIAGDFGSGGGSYVRHLAHVRADGSLGTLNPNTNGEISALALSGSTLYVGGRFTTIDGLTRIRVAAIDVTSETVTPWNAYIRESTSSFVSALAVENGLVYMGGLFDAVGNTARAHAAAVDETTGFVAPWNPVPNAPVYAFAISNGVVYMAGAFWAVGGQTRSALAAVDATSGSPTSWDPNASSACTALLVNGSTVYVGGGFSMIGGQDRRAFAAIDATTGAIRPWASTIDRDPIQLGPSVAGLAVIGSTLYIGGDFTSVGGEPRMHIAAIETATGQVLPWNPGATSRVYTMSAQDSIILATGAFDQLGGKLRNRLAAIDLVTGRATDWNPDANGIVRALAVNGSTVYAGGSFGTMGGQQHRSIVALDAVSGVPSPTWTAGANSAVRALAVSGSSLYVGGSFTNVGGQPRGRIAALDLTTGVPTAWQSDADGTVRALFAEGSAIYVGGDFDHVGGEFHMRVVAIDLATGNPVNWTIQGMPPGETVYALVLEGSTLYVGGSFTATGGQARKNLASLYASTGIATPWIHDYEKSVYSFAGGGAKGNLTYVGAGDVGGGGLFAFDATTGVTANWHPATEGSIFSVITDGTYVYAGGEKGVFVVAAPGVTGTLLSLFQAEKAPEGIVLRWQFGGAAEGAAFHLERSDSPTGPWTRLAAAIRRDGEDFAVTDRDVEAGRTYRYRLIVQLASGAMTFGPIEASTGPVRGFALTRVSPTPANGPVRIDFVVAREAPICLTVLDLQGRELASLIDGTMRPGNYQATWSGDASNGPAPSGVYFAHLKVAGLRMTKRLVLYR